jgi:hypothetical protein
MNKKRAMILLAAAMMLGGCKPMSFLLYALWPGAREKKIEAEYPGLADKTVAIVVYCNQDSLYEYPGVRLSLAAMVGEGLRKAKGLEGVRLVDPRSIVKYQDENIYWDEMDKTALGKAFGSDRVLFLSLMQYTTREPGSLNLYRGRITAQASVYDVSVPERQAKVWDWDNIRVVYPKNDPTGLLRDPETSIRYRTESIFADMLVKKFHDHKVPLE